MFVRSSLALLGKILSNFPRIIALPKSDLACRSAIRKRDTKPELAVRRFLREQSRKPDLLEITFLRSSELNVQGHRATVASWAVAAALSHLRAYRRLSACCPASLAASAVANL
jgi:hypothetical protein